MNSCLKEILWFKDFEIRLQANKIQKMSPLFSPLVYNFLLGNLQKIFKLMCSNNKTEGVALNFHAYK